ncbi:hypothetical protein ROZALSC1DRAFT_14879 [Rozella allomycis CSF55]|uniref:Ribosomal protein/NADH dehydrogenase domain-containing protein n=1 Tax=Rozella allomycis (strain CSF55) TaxID=988480 RepID=A0A4P9YIQ5_ROZAC|nr:hypothetical protein ROZALSC1DRAFT_14879 [Rozella allomycis CSF55]
MLRDSFPRHINGLNAHIIMLQKITLRYNPHRSTSSGMNEYLSSPLFLNAAKNNPAIEFVVEPWKLGHPVIHGIYATGIEKLVDAKKMTMIEIHEALEAMTQTENRVLKKFKPGVKSLNPAIRPIW